MNLKIYIAKYNINIKYKPNTRNVYTYKTSVIIEWHLKFSNTDN